MPLVRAVRAKRLPQTLDMSWLQQTARPYFASSRLGLKRGVVSGEDKNPGASFSQSTPYPEHSNSESALVQSKKRRTCPEQPRASPPVNMVLDDRDSEFTASIGDGFDARLTQLLQNAPHLGSAFLR
jgi:hypothetical protein